MIAFRTAVASIVFVFYGGFAHADILFDGRLDEGNFSRYVSLEANGAAYSGGKVPGPGIRGRLDRAIDPAGSGKLQVRSTINIGDARTNGGLRSEVSAPQDPMDSERWYSWSYYLPDTVKNNIVIAQIHDTADVGESDLRNPTLAVLVQDNRLKLINVFDYDRITSPLGTKPIAGIDFERRELTSWDLETGKWVDLDLHVKWAGDDTGFLEFWKDGITLFKENNHINTFNDERGLQFKGGVYDISNTRESVSTYFTGVMIGDEKETFHSMSMSTVPEPSVYLMMMLGLAGIGFFAYRRRTLIARDGIYT